MGTRDRHRDEPGDGARRPVHAVVIAAVHGAKPEADREGRHEPAEFPLKSQRAHGGNTGRRQARRGQTIRELVALGVRYIVDAPERSETTADDTAGTPWFSALRDYAPNARGAHDLESMRASVARARKRCRT